MKFGDQSSSNTFDAIIEESKKTYINYLAGLNFDPGCKLFIDKKGDSLILEGPVTKEVQDNNTGFAQITKKVTDIETREIALSDIQSIELSDESGRSIGKTALWGAVGTIALGPLGLVGGALLGARKRFKSFIVIQVKSEKINIPYQVVLGGVSQKEIRKYYDHLLKLIHEPAD